MGIPLMLLDMMSSSPSTVLSLTLDLNSQAHAPAPGVLKTLDLVGGAPHDFDLQLRVVHGSSILRFSFNGLEDVPTRATVESPDLDGLTKTPEIDAARQSKKDKIKDVDEQISSQPNTDDDDDDDAESLDSDKPIPTKRKRRAKPLHDSVVGDETYVETSHENTSNNTSHKRGRPSRKGAFRGTYVEPPKDARDIVELDAEISNTPRTNTPQSKTTRALNTPTPQKNLDNYGFRTAPQSQDSMKKMPDLYVGVDSKDNLDVNVEQDIPPAKRCRRF